MKKATTGRSGKKEQDFHPTPFSALKGVVVATRPAQAEAVAKTPPPAAPAQDDAELFLQAVSGVKPLKGQPAPAAHKAPAAAPRRTATRQPPPQETSEPGNELFLQEVRRLKLEVKFSDNVPNEDELLPLAGNRLRQIKKGVVAVTHQLDLHGLTRDEALGELSRFLRAARMKGEKAALVITGKGRHSAGEAVLQQAVASWLRDAGRDVVLEFAPAPREMGGSGAYVVFLRPPAPDSLTPSRHR